MPKLNDTQSVLLATAAQRDSGGIYPLPESITPSARVTKAITGLLSAMLVEERETNDPALQHRADGDLRFGAFITHAGLKAIGVEPDGSEQAGDTVEVPSPALPAAPPRQSKTSQVVALLARPEGATLPELIEATGWLPHTTRAALTGLRKKGHGIERSKRGEVTCYHIAAASAA